ncbi:hypothetical protein [Stenotrophomonas sp. A3_2]|uniref:hypothetical protein n=1 Tax=Stenotrophomonas sp. A3_2 TaxID=3119978 RepID=UPI002FC3C8AC
MTWIPPRKTPRLTVKLEAPLRITAIGEPATGARSTTPPETTTSESTALIWYVCPLNVSFDPFFSVQASTGSRLVTSACWLSRSPPKATAIGALAKASSRPRASGRSDGVRSGELRMVSPRIESGWDYALR